MRLDKLLSNYKYGTRTAVKKLIKSGKVTVNNAVVKDNAMHINPEIDCVTIAGEVLNYKKQIVFMMNKPKGVVSTRKDPYYKSVFDLLSQSDQRFDLSIAGRLDVDTEGLLLLTNDGALLHEIITPNKMVEKVYYVETKQVIDNIEALLKPMTLLDGNDTPYTPRKPKIITSDKNTAVIAICEGKYHQVKRMFAAINHEVVYLKRIAINKLTLDENLALGAYKILSEDEIQALINKEG